MDKFGRVALLFCVGALCHLLSPLIDALPRGWGNLTRCAIGFLMLWGGGLPFAGDYGDVPNPQTRWTLRYFSGGVPVGLGVVAAYIVGHFLSQEREK